MKCTSDETDTAHDGFAIPEVAPPDRDAMSRARLRQGQLTKPPGSLGRLETLGIRMAGIFGTEHPKTRGKLVVVAAGDHGVVHRGVTGYPQEVTSQMVQNFLSGGAAVCALARTAGADLWVVDAGIANPIPPSPGLRSRRIGSGTGDIAAGPAMSRVQAEACIEHGLELAVEAAGAGYDLIGGGEMGIGNTTPSAAIVAALTGHSAAECTGRGTGRSSEELRHKIAVVQAALDANRPDPNDPLDVLAKVGGFEIGVLAGLFLGIAAQRRIGVVDGFISTAGALLACSLAPNVRDYLVAAHRSAEQGHRIALESLNLDPLLELEMRLGEGSGAVLAMPIIESAAACLREMATFDEAAVSESSPPVAHPEGAK